MGGQRELIGPRDWTEMKSTAKTIHFWKVCTKKSGGNKNKNVTKKQMSGQQPKLRVFISQYM